MRILLIEDEKGVAGFIKKGLEEELYSVDAASYGEEGLLCQRDTVTARILLQNNIISVFNRDGAGVNITGYSRKYHLIADFF